MTFNIYRGSRVNVISLAAADSGPTRGGNLGAVLWALEEPLSILGLSGKVVSNTIVS